MESKSFLPFHDINRTLYKIVSEFVARCCCGMTIGVLVEVILFLLFWLSFESAELKICNYKFENVLNKNCKHSEMTAKGEFYPSKMHYYIKSGRRKPFYN